MKKLFFTATVFASVILAQAEMTSVNLFLGGDFSNLGKHGYGMTLFRGGKSAKISHDGQGFIKITMSSGYKVCQPLSQQGHVYLAQCVLDFGASIQIITCRS